MIEIRYADSYGGASALSGMPVMNDNCYYIDSRSASFNDNRGSKFSGGLAAWKSHISGENNSIEVNPSLDANYLPTNTQCAGMGIQFPLSKEPMGIDTPAPLSETIASVKDGVLYVQNQAAENVQGYSSIGTLLFNFQKPVGNVTYSFFQPKGSMIILNGSSGWTKKLVVQ